MGAAVYHLAARESGPSQPSTVKEPHAYHNFTAIRRACRHNGDISHQARHLFEDICELAERDGYCSASQKHFAKTYGTTTRSVKRWEKELRDAGYLASEQAADVVEGEADGRRRVLRPTMPPAKVGDTVRPLDRGHETEIGDTAWSEIGDTPEPTPRDNTPPLGGESGARARTREDGQADTDGSSASLPLTSRQEASRNEGGSARRDDSPLVVDGPHAGLVQPEDAPAVAVYVSRTGRRPTPLQGGEIATAVGEAPDRLATFAAVCEIWMGAGYQTANHRRLLRHFEEEMAGGTVASRPHERQGTPPRRQDSGTYADARAHVERLTEFK